MPSNWLVFDRIRALTKNFNIYPVERIFSNQSNLDKLTAGGEFLDFNQSAAILDQTNLQINRLERYKDYEQMDQTGEISLALDLYADEASLVDPEVKHTLVIKAKTRRIKKELEELFYNVLHWDNQLRPTVRYLCKYGDLPFEVILDANRTGVTALKYMSVYNFTRIETRYGDLVGFFYSDPLWSKPMFLHPWQVMHLRLSSFENIFAPYGRSILDGGRKAFKQLRLMEDAALIYRITRAPEKRKFTIPVGNIPPKEVPEYLQMIARNFKRQRFYNPTTGSFDERYSPLIQEDDFFLPRRADGSGPDVETLPGGENMDKIQDIEYFKKKMIAPMKIPFARVGIGEGAGEANEKSLSQSSSEFAKSVQWIQREVSAGLTKVAIVHLALRGFGADDLKGFTINCTANSAMEELYRIETWATRVNVMSDIKGLGWFPKDWIVTHFTDLSPDEIQEIDEYAANEEEGGGGGGGGGSGGGSSILGDMGAGLDIGGGDEGGGDGGLGDLDLGGAPGAGPEDAGAEAAGGETPDVGGDAAAAAAPPEPMEGRIRGYDYEAEDRVINEMRSNKKKERRREILESWRKKRGDFVGDEAIVNGFQALMESKELDGLTKGGYSAADEFGYTRPLGSSIFKVTISEDVIREVIKENYEVIVNKDDVTATIGDSVISEADLPKI
jgi:hypothetical protein